MGRVAPLVNKYRVWPPPMLLEHPGRLRNHFFSKSSRLDDAGVRISVLPDRGPRNNITGCN